MMSMDGMMDMEGMSEVGMPAKGAKPDKVKFLMADFGGGGGGIWYYIDDC